LTLLSLSLFPFIMIFPSIPLSCLFLHCVCGFRFMQNYFYRSLDKVLSNILGSSWDSSFCAKQWRLQRTFNSEELKERM
jgi:hypothetical protein